MEAAVVAVTLFVLGSVAWLAYVVHRHEVRLRGLVGVARALADEVKAQGGAEVKVDPALLGEPVDVAPPGEDEWTRAPESIEPWGVK